MGEEKIIIRQFFTLLRAGLGKESADSRLFSVQEDVKWNLLLHMAEEQTVVAVMWDGMLTLPKELHPGKTLFYRWLTKVIRIEKSNEQMNAALQEIMKIIEDLNIPAVLLKGQGTGALYPNPLHRQCGDIDVYSGQYSNLLQRVLPSLGFVATGHSDGKHSELQYKGIVVENHHHIEEFFYFRHKKAFKKMVNYWYPFHMVYRKVENTDTPIPPSWFEALLGVAHFGKHLLCVGVGIRHLCDWAMILHTQSDFLDRTRLKEGVKKLGLENLASVMADLSVNYLKMPEEEFTFLIKDTQRVRVQAELLLEDMLRVGNFGQHDPQKVLEKGLKGFIRLLWKKGKRNYEFWPFYRIEALLMPLSRIRMHFKR